METPEILNVTPLNAPQRELDWQDLADLDYQISEASRQRTTPHLQLLSEFRTRHRDGTDILGIWESALPLFKMPSCRQFPDLIHLCASQYEPSQRAVVNHEGEVVFYTTPQAIRDMVQFRTDKPMVPLSLLDLINQGQKTLTEAEILRFNQLFISKSDKILHPPIFDGYLNQLGLDLAHMVSAVLGYKSTEFIEETVLVMMLRFVPGRAPICYNYATYISDKIHEQFLHLPRERMFRYSSYIFHLILYHQYDKFSFEMKRTDAAGNPRSVVYWSSIFHISSPYTYCEFIDSFIHPAMSLLLKESPPRLTEDMKRILQLSTAYSIGDWYFYQHHTVIRMYGCELRPFKLPRFVPMRLFALEYFRQFAYVDLVHFSGRGKKAQLKVKNQLGHIVLNKREGWKEAERMLENLGLTYSFPWKPYDPNGFISKRRLKYKLASYEHHNMILITRHANQPKWQKNTLVEPLTQEELNERARRHLLKMADLECPSQVPTLPGPQTTVPASSTATQGEAAETSKQGQDKGKGKIMEETEGQQGQQEQQQDQHQTDQQDQERQQGEGQPAIQEKTTSMAPPKTDSRVDPSLLQTPLREDISRKRERETPLTEGSEKRQRLNPFGEEEMHSFETSASSIQHEQDRTALGEVSSSGQGKSRAEGIKDFFRDAKRRSEPLKIKLYNYLLNMAPSNQQRLMSAYDVHEAKLTLSHFTPTEQRPQSTADYIRTNLEVLAKDIHPMDQIELHKQTGEMVYATLADKTLVNYKLQNSLNNTASQLELERASSQAKDNRIKALEDIIIEFGHDPNDIKAIQEVLKLRDADLAAIKKRMKIPPTIHPQTDEVAQQRRDKDITNLLMTLYKELVETQQRLLETENTLEATIQKGEQGQSSKPPTEIIINLEDTPKEDVPPKQDIPPKEATETKQAEETAPATIEGSAKEPATAATPKQQAESLDMQKLRQEIQVLEAQMTELNKAKETLAKIEEKYDKSKQNVAEREREVKALRKTIAELEKQLNFDKVTAEIKQVIWTAIGQAISNQWEYIVAIYEQIGLIGKAKKELYRARNDLGSMADLAPKMIEVLNYRNSSQLIQMGIANRTETISIIKRTTTMKSLIQTLDRRVNDMQADITKFQNRFTALQDKGLPSLEESGKLLSYEKYIKRLSTFSAMQIAEASGSSTTGPLTGQALFNKLDNLFFIKNEVTHLFDKPPDFYKYTDVDETVGSILKHQLPHPDNWQDLVKLLLNQG